MISEEEVPELLRSMRPWLALSVRIVLSLWVSSSFVWAMRDAGLL